MRPELIADIGLRRILRLAGRRVDIGALRVLGDGDAQRITPKAIGVLLELARETGVTRTRDELLQRVWGGRAGDGDVLTQAVKELRRIFGDDLATPRFIETVPRLGYRLLVAVEWDDSATVAVAGSSVQAASESTRWRARALGWLGARRWAVALLLAAVGAFAVGLHLSGKITQAANWQVPAAPDTAPSILTAEPGAESTPRLSPDGSRVAYVAIDPDTTRLRIHVRGITATSPFFPTRGAGEESWPVWSADGMQLAFVRHEGERCELVSVDALGGAERMRSRCDAGMFEGFDWAADGSSFLLASFDGPGTARLRKRSLESGELLPFDYAHDDAEHDLAPRYSPDGRTIAFRRGLSPYSDVYLVAADGGPVRRLTHVAARIQGFDWMADSRAIIVSSDHAGTQALYRVDLAQGEMTALGISPAQMPDVARNNDVLAFEVPRARTYMQGVVLDAIDSAAAELAPSTGSDSHPVLADDGARICFVSDRGGSRQLWLHDATTRQTFPLTTDRGALYLFPQWHADGRRVLITRRADGRGSLIEIDLNSQAQRVVSPANLDVRFGTYAADGDGYLVIAPASDGPRLLQISAGEPTPAVLRQRVGAVAVDTAARQIYYSRVDGSGVYVLGASEADDRQVARVGNRFAWRIRAGALWYFDATDADEIQLHRHGVNDATDSIVWRTRDAIDHRHFDLSADARRLLLTRSTRVDTDIGLLRNLRRDDQ